MTSDREHLTHIINLYGFAVDTQDFNLFDQIFSENVEADIVKGALAITRRF